MTDNNWNEEATLSNQSIEDIQEIKVDDKIWMVVERALTQSSVEQRRSRRWGIFFKALTLGYLVSITIFVVSKDSLPADGLGIGPHTAVVPVDGVIAAGEDARAVEIQRNLKAAFESQNAKGVMLEINSPGGSPVQAEYVYRTLVELKAQYPEKPVHAVISDIGASGAYYVAAAADSIHAAPSSIVGSIGVVSGGFGFTGLMEKLGVERRLVTAGDNKAMLDPFLPQDISEREYLQTLLDQTHKQFIQRVLDGRGDRLNSNEDIFDGRIFSGVKALELGLIDSLATPSEVARDWIGAEDRVYYRSADPIFKQISREFGFGVGTSLSWMIRHGVINPMSLNH